uniref:Probable quinone oxidoreductase n=1 Tax=Brachypodium distachyon TaxID=15368 RepID=C3SAD1_BRADI|nr:quinone oxidoreductase [Brachypodium distachyon]
MRWEQVEVGPPGDGEIRVKNTAVGVNFIDVYFRKGVYSAPLPFTPGMEAVGVVTAVGPGLTGRKVGDVVAYAGKPMGSYAEEQVIPADVAVSVPPSVDHRTAAAIMLKGMTAHVLLRRVFKGHGNYALYVLLRHVFKVVDSPLDSAKSYNCLAHSGMVESGHTVLVHAAAGGVGSLLCQWANALGATVIGTVSSEEKAAHAAQDGCHHVIIYTKEDVATRVKEITDGKGVNVVYDSVGKDTYKASMECLASRGFLVSFGQSSGSPDPIPMSDLAPKSLFLTRPSMLHYTGTRDELLHSAGEVFANVANGVLRIRVNHTYPLSEAAQAHADLEARKTSGSILLIP